MTKNFFAIIILTIGLVACKKSGSDVGTFNGSWEANGLSASTQIGPQVNNKLKDVTISTSASKFENTELFTWYASGGVTDEGVWTDDRVIWGAVRSPVVGTLHDTFTLNGTNGTIKLSFDGLLKPTADPNLFQIEGHWRILSGTGLYNALVGQGSGTVIINFSESTATSTLWGQVKQ